MSKKKEIKEKNELDELLQTIKKSLNNKATLTKDDMSTALEVIEINKVKKELLDTTEKMTALRYVEKQKIKTALNNTLNCLKRELNPLLEKEQTENVSEAQQIQNN